MAKLLLLLLFDYLLLLFKLFGCILCNLSAYKILLQHFNTREQCSPILRAHIVLKKRIYF